VSGTTRIAATAVAALFLAIYLPAVGGGFLKDDFAWIETARVSGPHDIARIFSSHTGFYRPLVTLTFSADYALWGLQPLGYGITNLILAAACALLLYRLVRHLDLPPAAGLAAAGVWLFNFHAVNMALLWLSGRTSLLVTLFALGTAHAMLRGRSLIAGALCACALLSKEEAVLLPALWWSWEAWVAWSAGGSRPKAPGSGPKARGPGRVLHAANRATARTWPLWLALAAYAVLRSRSGAFTASTAPGYYQFSSDPGLLVRNLLAYTDRAGTVAAATIIVLVIACGWRAVRLAPDEWLLVRLAIVWIPATYALTVFLPIRSSLYALLPSVGSALVAAAVASAARRASPVRFQRAAASLLVLVLLLLPVYYARNERWTGAADISARVMTLVRNAASTQPAGHVVLIDAPAPITFDDVFSGLFSVGVQLVAGPQWTGDVVPPGGSVPDGATLMIELRDGSVVITGAKTAGATSGGAIE
jgi:hypothetical protein